MHYNENNLNLINNSLGVITINSAAGYEAIILKKAVITLGNEFYAKDKICIKIKNVSELPSILLEIKKNPKWGIEDSERKKLIYEYSKNAFQLNTYHFWRGNIITRCEKKRILNKYKKMEKLFLRKRK